MTDSSSSLSSLQIIERHISKLGIQESRSEDANNGTKRMPVPFFGGAQPGTFSDTRITFSPGSRLPAPSFSLSESPIQSVLARQVANMLLAKELKKQQEEEKQKLEEEMKKIKLEEDDCIIDLMKAVQIPYKREPPVKEEVLSSSSSFESLFEPKFIDCDSEEVKKPAIPLLPCKTDMSYILFQKVRRGKCSAFGRVLTARVRPVAAPYMREPVQTTIVPFDFKTPSPCDLAKAKLKRPLCYNKC